jgi:DMSO/TMAO reductase YedYZ heme-binding membrane subunit
MKAVALLLAIVFFVLGILYWMGTINFFTKSGTEHAHHVTHAIALWILAFLCLIWARFQSSPAR